MAVPLPSDLSLPGHDLYPPGVPPEPASPGGGDWLADLPGTKAWTRTALQSAPALYPAALAMLLVSSAAFILAERLVDINTLSASLFGLAFYGLLGLWLDPQRWRQGLPAALLLIATLPFGEHLQTFVGYPVRLITAGLVRDGLSVSACKPLASTPSWFSRAAFLKSTCHAAG